ncbi:uncharacterized protein SPAPADRAFT_61167 [Spathaspora passalidarum NRRL Y-27907]|uniref:Tyrosine specific protein phosphatases domain-containing protein n=1 Tax=Spathaspora passalidarum (strain NRRL Y-27907 / 11-Y1) TaxID=619300 RepID=G3APA9_SPAPN|nr:uncharacterized protein SPAPADRAFT_61167 [Spathaspora passalidarum NRRL Y-27907]EGW32086.1 hypothetical protein SPAPADRAFT_61167 [Spathaspora passalidarum NRRL Y-27907]
MTAPSRYNPPPPREVHVRLGKGVSATLAIPHSVDAKNPFEAGFAPATHKAALILHGQAGHRNYCYQKLTAHRLAAELGIYSLRIDFRGCGDSADNVDRLVGRQLEQDLEDIQDSVEFLMDGTKNTLGIDLTLSSIIAHSRGGVAMFLWAQNQDALLKRGDPRAIIVPNLVNCSTRYDSPSVMDRYSFSPDTDFIPIKMFRHGKLQEMELAAREIYGLAIPDFSNLYQLSRDWSVLSVYGLQDNIIPVDDFTNFANVLNRGRHSHRLEVIPDADHNFYGTTKMGPDDDIHEFNPHNYPIKRGVINYNALVSDYIIDYLSPENEMERFLSTSNVIGRVSRWKEVEGVNNFRDIGGWRIHSPTFKLRSDTVARESHAHLNYYVKPHVAFRCANISGLTPKGAETLQTLGIKAIFDLRSDGEVKQDGYPQNLEQYGIVRIHAPVFTNDDYSPQAIALRYTNLMTSWSTYIHVYEDMLELGTFAYKTVFEFIRDQNQPFVFHCTAGKDRTGILGMLILLLAGVDKNTIAREYELTTVGLRPDHPILRGKFQETVRKLREKLGDSGAGFDLLMSHGRKNWRVEEDGFENLISSRYEAMLATVGLFMKKYGSITNYMKNKLHFSQEDIIKIYENLVVVDPQNFGFEASSHVNWDHRNMGKAKF